MPLGYSGELNTGIIIEINRVQTKKLNDGVWYKHTRTALHISYRRLNIKTSYMDFFQESTFLHGGILCSNAHILSKRRTPTPIISGVKGLFCDFVASKCRIRWSKRADFGRF